MTAAARVAGLTALLAAGSVALQGAWIGGTPAVTGRRAALAVILTVLFALGERFVVLLPVRRGSHTLSLSEIPTVVGLMLLPPGIVALARLGGGLIGLTVFRRQRGGLRPPDTGSRSGGGGLSLHPYAGRLAGR
jgi:hypothetical protein